MAGWQHSNAVIKAKVDKKALLLAEHMLTSRCLKEAAWKADIPIRTARRLIKRVVSG